MVPSFHLESASGSPTKEQGFKLPLTTEKEMVKEKVDTDKKSSNNMMLLSVNSSSSSTLTVPKPGGVFPLPDSQQMASSSSSSGSATGNPRNKVGLKPGYSLMDWIRLTKSGKDLSGTKGKLLKVTKSELKEHSYKRDAWMAIYGKVYNVTSYMDYHPGGWDELVKGVGKDATDLFNEVHRWVNYESMLAACLVGKLVDDEEEYGKDFSANQKKNKSSDSLDTGSQRPFTRPNGFPTSIPVIPPIRAKVTRPSFDCHQTDTSFVVSIFTKCPDCLTRENVIVEITNENNFICKIIMIKEQTVYKLHYELTKKASLKRNDSSVKVSRRSGKVEIVLNKKEKSSTMWAKIGQPFEDNDEVTKVSAETVFRDWTLVERVKVTHDVDHLLLEPPTDNEGFHSFVPVGHHVRIRADVEGMEIVRNYTPVLESLEPLLIDDGRIHLLVKNYENGALTRVLKKLNIGQKVSLSDHVGKFDALSQLENVQHLILLAAGTGFTPMAKVIQAYLGNLKSSQSGKITLLFFNKTLKDIIWKEELQKLDERFENFFCHYILSEEPDKAYKGLKGKISETLISKILFSKKGLKMNSKNLVCICGPPGFSETAKRLMMRRDFSKEEIVLFEG